MYSECVSFKLNLKSSLASQSSALYDAARRALGGQSRAHTRAMSSSSSPCATARAQGARGVVRAVRQPRDGSGACARANVATRAVVRANAARATRQGRVMVVVGAISGSDRAKTSSTGAQGEEDGDESSSLLDISTSSSTTDARGKAFVSSAVVNLLKPAKVEIAEAKLKALTTKASSETQSLLSELAPYERVERDVGDWEEYTKLRQDALRRGVAITSILGITLATVTSTLGVDGILASLESVPPLAAFEQLVGFAVMAYYGVAYRRALFTIEGREMIRVNVVDAISKIAGAAELAGRMAAMDETLDTTIVKTIADIEKMPREKVPDNVRQAIAVYIRSREEEKVRKADEIEARAREEAARAAQAQAKRDAEIAERERARAEEERRAEEKLQADSAAQAAATMAASEEQRLAEQKRAAEAEAEARKIEWFTNINAFMAAREAASAQVAATEKPIAAAAPEIITSVSGVSQERWFELIDEFFADDQSAAAEAARDAEQSAASSTMFRFGEFSASQTLETPLDSEEAKTRWFSIIDAFMAKRRVAQTNVAVAEEVQAKLSALEAEKDAYAKEIDELKTRVKNEEIAKIEALDRVKELKVKVIALEKSVEELKAANAALANVEVRNAELVARVQALTSENETLTARVGEVTAMLRAAERDAEIAERDATNALREQRAETERVRRALEEQLQGETRSVRAAEELAKRAAADVERLNAELQSAITKQDETTSMAQRLQAELAKAQETTQELERARAEKMSLTEQTQAFENEISALRSQYASATNEIATSKIAAETRLAQLRGQLDELVASQSSHEQAIEAVRVASAAEARATFERDMESLKLTFAEETFALNEAVTKLRAEKDAASENLFATEKRAKEDIEKFKAELKRLRDEAALAASTLADAERAAAEQVRELRSQIDADKSASGSLVSELERAKTVAMTKSEELRAELERAEATAQEQAQKLNAELDRLRAEKDATASELDAAKNAALVEVAKLQQDVARLTEAKTLAESTLATARGDAASRADELNAAISALRADLDANVVELRRTQSAAEESQRTYASELASARDASAAEIAAVKAAAVADAKRLQSDIERLQAQQATTSEALRAAEERAAAEEKTFSMEVERMMIEARHDAERLERAKAAAVSELDTMRMKFEALVTTKTALERDVEQSKNALLAAQEKARRDVEAAKSAAASVVEKLQSEMKAIREEKESTTKALADAQTQAAEAARLREERANLEVRGVAAEKRIAELNAELAAAMENLEASSATVRELQVSAAQATASAEEARTELEVLKITQRDTQAALDAAKEDVKEAARLRKLSDALESRLADADTRVAELTEELRLTRATVASEVEELTATRDALVAQLEAARATSNEATTAAEAELAAARKDLLAMEDLVSAAVDEAALDRALVQEQAAAEAQAIAERSARELAEYESRFAAQLEELEAKLLVAEQAAAEANAKAELLAKRAANADEKAVTAQKITAKSVTNTPPPTDATSTSQPVLSKMKRAELIAECETRGLPSDGVVAELRARLREARKAEASSSKTTTARKAPEGFYRTINRKKYDNQALLLADAMMAADGKISRAGAEKIYENVFDGAGVTAIELETLALLLAGGDGKYSYKLSDGAISYLQPRVDARREDLAAAELAGRKRPSSYRVINGVKYDDKALTLADDFMRVQQKITAADAERIYDAVLDGTQITTRERDTLELIILDGATYALDDDARQYLRDKIADIDKSGN
jgi:chromosome segregation ATPase/transcriptional regulator CtsR